MNKKTRLILLLCLLLSTVLAVSACSSIRSPYVPPYDEYDDDGYNVSIKFDANGGEFAPNTTTRVDTYKLSDYETLENGKKAIKLFDPNDPVRGDQAYLANYVNGSGYYLAGWYTNRAEVQNDDGSVSYEYSGRWNFDEKLMLDADGEYSANNPVLTLYAAWVPAFTYEFVQIDELGNETVLGEKKVNPTVASSVELPKFNENTGKMGYTTKDNFPTLTDKTYDKIYYDKEMTAQVTDTHISHTGTFNAENATVENAVMKVYCKLLDGVWYTVDSAEKLRDAAFSNAHIILSSDIDFTDSYWPNGYTTRTFYGGIYGNGYSIKNVTIEQSSSSDINFGLFGQIGEGAVIENVAFDNITVNIKNGTTKSNAQFGIIAGSISDAAQISNVTLKNSEMVISSTEKFAKTLESLLADARPKLGLISGTGNISGFTFSDNNTVSFSTFSASKPEHEVYYDYTIDADGRFVLTRRESE